MNKNKFALLVSSLFEPMLVVYILGLLGGMFAQLPSTSWWMYFSTITFFCGLVVFLRLFFKRKDHTNWDISERKKRFGPLTMLVVSFAIAYMLIRSFGNDVLTRLFLSLFIWHLGFLLLTLKVKLSGHMGILTLAIGQLVGWYGTRMLPLLCIIPLLAWSRIYLKRHTRKEVIIGIAYSTVILLLPTLY